MCVCLFHFLCIKTLLYSRFPATEAPTSPMDHIMDSEWCVCVCVCVCACVCVCVSICAHRIHNCMCVSGFSTCKLQWLFSPAELHLPLYLTAVMCVAAILAVFLFLFCLLMAIKQRRTGPPHQHREVGPCTFSSTGRSASLFVQTEISQQVLDGLELPP